LEGPKPFQKRSSCNVVHHQTLYQINIVFTIESHFNAMFLIWCYICHVCSF